jgi:hypothetical protein
MSSLILSSIQSKLNLYGYSIFGIVGLVGNIFIVILFSQHRQNACSIYLISSSIMNSIYLIYFAPLQLFPVHYNDGTLSSVVLCKTNGYVLNVVGQIARTMIVLACVDRFMITSDRATLRSFSTVKRSKWLIVISISFWFLFNIHIPIMQTVVNGQCVRIGIYSTIYTFYAILFVGSMPPIILGIFGYLTYRHMRQMHLRVQPVTSNTTNGNNSIQRRDRDLLILVISEVFVYIITATLFPLILLEMMISNYLISNKSVQYSQIEGFILIIAYLLLFINSAAPFYTYLIVSKAFSRDFKQLIRNSYRKLTRQQIILPVTSINQASTKRDTRV